MDKLWNPLKNLRWVERKELVPNDYNPNRVSRKNLELLTTSIFVNGFTLPIPFVSFHFCQTFLCPSIMLPSMRSVLF